VGLAILTVSDTRTIDTDESGTLIRDLAEKAGHVVHEREIVPDDPARIRETLTALLATRAVQAILVTGGTGISGRDRTHQAIAPLLDAVLPGYGEIFRQLSYQEIGAAAMLSRAVAGVASGKPVFSMPGSARGVRLAMEKLILPEIGHVVAEATRHD